MDSGDIWGVVKLRLGLQDDQYRAIVESYIDEVRYRIKHYCKIKKIPEELKFIWVSMVIDLVRIDLPHINEINDTVGGGESIKIGDTSVSPASSTGVSNVSKNSIEQVVLNYTVDLNRYRKLRW